MVTPATVDPLPIGQPLPMMSLGVTVPDAGSQMVLAVRQGTCTWLTGGRNAFGLGARHEPILPARDR